jgi:hypothetical protein
MKLTIIYDPDRGYLFADGKAEEWVDETIDMFNRAGERSDDPEWRIKVCSALLVDYFRLRLAQKKIKADQIAFEFKDQTLIHNKYGRLEKWPKGFCDYTDDILTELLSIGLKASKEKK